jgi:hypothetical protein
MNAHTEESLPVSSKPRRIGAWCAAALLSTLAVPLHAQSLSLSGSLWIYQPNARPIPAVGYKVYLYNKQSGWSRPSYTDGAGRYAHYGVRPDKYLLHVRDNQNKVMWQQDVTLNNSGPSQVPWIILPRA